MDAFVGALHIRNTNVESIFTVYDVPAALIVVGMKHPALKVLQTEPAVAEKPAPKAKVDPPKAQEPLIGEVAQVYLSHKHGFGKMKTETHSRPCVRNLAFSARWLEAFSH